MALLPLAQSQQKEPSIIIYLAEYLQIEKKNRPDI